MLIKPLIFWFECIEPFGRKSSSNFLIIGCVCWDGPFLYHAMLKFRPYHKFWCFNQNTPTKFHFLMHSTSPFHLFIRSLRKSWSEEKSTTRMLKFRLYHKCWCFNEKLPMTFHFLDALEISNLVHNVWWRQDHFKLEGMGFKKKAQAEGTGTLYERLHGTIQQFVAKRCINKRNRCDSKDNLWAFSVGSRTSRNGSFVTMPLEPTPLPLLLCGYFSEYSILVERGHFQKIPFFSNL